MLAMGVRAFGPAKTIEPLDVEKPTPKPGEAIVSVRFAGVNHVDIAMRNGVFAKSAGLKTSLPLVLGMEASGEVQSIGADVEDLKAGDRVAYCLSFGSYAEYAAVPAWRLVKVPDDVPLDVATALMLQGSTAHYLTTSAFPLREGDVALVHAGAGGVGQLLIQLARIAGAVVIATVGGAQDKGAIARSRGAAHVVYRDNGEDFQKAVMEITSGAGANVVYDGIGKETIAGSLRSVARRGVLVSLGQASGPIEHISPQELGEQGSIFFTRPHLADYLREKAEVSARAKDLFDLYLAGRLAVPVDRVYPLDGAGEAHGVLEGRKARGKILLKVV
ncbi:MAG: quinone oxidoreductase [Hyphomicrobiaceae bacterium]|nr:MAG: quinone oxidoreductase [Hyphomicrobiaceae bacterium]